MKAENPKHDVKATAVSSRGFLCRRKTSSSAMAERLCELGDFKKARVNAGLAITLLRVSHKCLRSR